MKQFDQYFLYVGMEINGRDFPWRKEGVSPICSHDY